MVLKNDRQITISVGNSRKDMNWKPQIISLSDLWEKLKTPLRGTETIAQYLALKKTQQDDLKDVGGFVGGTLRGGRRKADAVIGRDLVTLDFDTIPAYGTGAILQTVDGLGCAYAIYSTRKHQETAPRLRIIIPLDRTASVDEYEPIARRLAEKIGIEKADPTTFEASRLMYWPSCCSDTEYVFKYGDFPIACVETILATYDNWRDVTSWPTVPGSEPKAKQLAAKQGDPKTKPGIVGAFNRVYDIETAMETFLPGTYAPVDNASDRYTYLGGSTTGGAVLYENGKFLYSYHATDPCSGKLVNAFDLVRIHLFGGLDDEAKPDTPVNRLPSFKAMCDLALKDKLVKVEAINSPGGAAKDFAGVGGGATQNAEWKVDLETDGNGKCKPTIENILWILENDVNLKNKFALNRFSGRGEVLGVLPWDERNKRRLWSDTDNNGLYYYMEKEYRITKRQNIDTALDLHSSKHAFNEVQDYLSELEWDGVPRLDTLFIDYLGAEDDPAGYTRAVTRKAFTGAVARAMDPGCKYDQMLILCGEQGAFKSTILDKMSRGWFNDSIRDFNGKEASELLQGVWIVEIAELDAFRKSEVSRIKQFLSLRFDRFRAAYGKNVQELPRCCAFFGTCNYGDFLRDTTGNRRFWPVDVVKGAGTKNVWKDLDGEIDQIWAEAKTRWAAGEKLFVTGEVEKEAQRRQEQHRETSPKDGIVRAFIEKPIPKDWNKWRLDRRRDFWACNAKGNYELVERDKICAIELWCELFNGSTRDNRKMYVDELNGILRNIPGWKEINTSFGVYEQQRGFVRISSNKSSN